MLLTSTMISIPNLLKLLEKKSTFLTLKLKNSKSQAMYLNSEEKTAKTVMFSFPFKWTASPLPPLVKKITPPFYTLYQLPTFVHYHRLQGLDTFIL